MEKKSVKPSRRRYIITAGLLLIIFALLYLAYSNQRQTEPDSLSETLILKEAGWLLGKEPNDLISEDLERIKFIILGDLNANYGVGYDVEPMFRLRDFETSKLCDIKAIEELTNLEHLTLQYIRWPENKIPEWMRFLTKLGIIKLDKRFNIDLKPIENLQYLQGLNIFDTPVSNFESVKNLANLKTLLLYNTNVSDLEPLKKLKNLKSLNIVSCPDISEREIKDLQKELPDLNITYEK